MSFDKQHPTPFRPSGQVSCFQVAETPHAYLFTLEVPKAVIEFVQSLYFGVAHVKAFFAASVQKQISGESHRIRVHVGMDIRKKETLRQGRILSSAVRRQKRINDLSRNEAISLLADSFRLPVKQAETYITLHNRRREDRINNSRINLARRYHAQGLSLSAIGKRLKVSKSNAGRIMDKVREMDSV